ncbi:MAG: AAA family ATPase [Myxococcota bacterium]
MDPSASLERTEEACNVLGVELLEVVHGEPGDFIQVCRVRLPRLPINLPSQKTALVLMQAREFDPASTQADPRFIEDSLGRVLREMGQSMGTPFLLMTDLDEEPLPTLVQARFPGVVFRGERLRELLFAEVPRQKLAQAILMDAWLDAISPYKSSGPVDDPAMFMGRERVRRELISSRSVSAIICGGRRVGKTSLIRQLVRDLGRERPDMKVYEISLLGIRSYSDFVERLERRMEINGPRPTQPPAQADDQDSEGTETKRRGSVLERLRRRRAQNRVQRSLTPDVAAATVREALEGRFVESGHQPLLIMDEIDGIAARDAEAGYPLLSTLHQLKAEGICSFVLVGFAELYRQTYDYDSPLYNFARVLQLRGLDDAAALRLVTEPMARLGVLLEDPWIAQEIVTQTAGLPNLVQFICDMLLRGLSEQRRTQITCGDLEAILDFENPVSQPLSAYLAESFDQNVERREELLVYTLLLHGPRPSSLSDIAANLEPLGIETSLSERRAMVRRLKLVGVLEELPGERFDLALPLLVRLLLSKDLKAAIAALEDELRQEG